MPIVNYLALNAEGAYLTGELCRTCGARYLGRRNGCGRCGGTSFSTVRLATTGTVRTFAVVHRSGPGVPVPFVSVVVDLDGGPSVKTNLTDVDPSAATAVTGMPVRLVTFPAGRDANGTAAVAFGFSPT